jgi:hypothetical protein
MTLTALPPKGLKMMSVLFVHPTECLLEEFHAERARCLGYKYIKAAFVQTEEGLAVRVILRCFNGKRSTRRYDTLSMAPDTLLNYISAAIDEEYENWTQMVAERNHQEQHTA